MANTIQIKHSPNSTDPATMSGSTHDLSKGELAWVDHGSGGANGKLYIGDATAAGAVQRHIGGIGTGAVAAAAAAGSLTGNTLASGVTASSLTSVGTIASGTWEGTTVAAAQGGTGLTSTSTLLNSNVTKSSLGLVIGTNVQAYDAQLDTLAGASGANATAVTNLTGTNSGDQTLPTASSLSLVIGTNVQAYDAQLDTLAGASGANATAVTNLTGTNSGDESTASLTAAGIVELATTSETTTGTATNRAVTPAGVQAAIDALVDSAPGALNTLNEIAAALGDDSDYASTITTALALKSTIASPTFTGTIAIPNISNIETAITANTAKSTNVATNLSISGSTAARTIASSDGTDAVIPVATTSVSGVMNPTMFDQLAALEALTLSGSNTGDQTLPTASSLGLVIGTNVQAYDAQLAALAGVSSTNTTAVGNLTGTNSGDQTLPTASSLSLVIGTNVQAYDAQLDTLAGASGANATAVTNLTGTNSGDEVAATDSTAGVIELATNAETVTGSATNRAITPANLAASTITGGTF